jgi:hypothetical protein
VTHDPRVKAQAFSVALLVSLAFVAGARANGDPASDALPFGTVFLSAQEPTSVPSGRALLTLTKGAVKKGFPVRVAVIWQPSDLGLIGSLWLKPQPYATFLGKELASFGRYHGTLVVSMPNGYGVFGPGATAPAKKALAALPKPGNGDVDSLGNATVRAVLAVASANGHALPAPPKESSGTPTWVILLAALGAAAIVGGAIFLGLRRWLTHA